MAQSECAGCIEDEDQISLAVMQEEQEMEEEDMF